MASEQGKAIASLVRRYVGCSLKNRTDELAQLVARGVDDPKQVVLIKTNCGMFALGILAKIGVQHPLLANTYKSGMAIAWLLQIANDKGALRTLKDGVPTEGALLHYGTPGKNNDHVEFLLADPSPTFQAEHAGGGRADNLVDIGTSDIRTSMGRPLLHWVDPSKLFMWTSSGIGWPMQVLTCVVVAVLTVFAKMKGYV
jgi:hypothetical protein